MKMVRLKNRPRKRRTRTTARRATRRNTRRAPKRRTRTTRRKRRGRKRNPSTSAMVRYGSGAPSAFSRKSNRRRRRSSRQKGFLNLVDGATLAAAGGTVAAGFLSAQVLGLLKDSQGNPLLPGTDQPIVAAGYKMVIPLAGAYVLRKKFPNTAKGLVIGSIVLGLTDFLNYIMAMQDQQNTGAWLNARRPRTMGGPASPATPTSLPAFNQTGVRPMGARGIRARSSARPMGAYIGGRNSVGVQALTSNAGF